MAACPDIPDADIPAMPELSALLTHIVCDLHDISAAIGRLETVVDEFAPLARQARSRFVLKNMRHRERA